MVEIFIERTCFYFITEKIAFYKLTTVNLIYLSFLYIFPTAKFARNGVTYVSFLKEGVSNDVKQTAEYIFLLLFASNRSAQTFFTRCFTL